MFEKYMTDPIRALRERALEALAAIREGKHWSDWRAIAGYLAEGRKQAMIVAGEQNPDSYAVRKAFSHWLDENPEFRVLDNATRAHLFWYGANSDAVEKWRDDLPSSRKMQMNHPSVVKRNYERAFPPPKAEKIEAGEGEERKRKETLDTDTLREELLRMRADIIKERDDHGKTRRALADAEKNPLHHWQVSPEDAALQLFNGNHHRAERIMRALAALFGATIALPEPETLALPPAAQATCAHCGKPFAKTHPRGRFCSDKCRSAHQRDGRKAAKALSKAEAGE